MSYKCRICGVNDVENQGDICELCEIEQDDYAPDETHTPSADNSSYNHRRGSNRKVLVGGNAPQTDYNTQGSSSQPVQVYSAGGTVQKVGSILTATGGNGASGSAKNGPVSTGIAKNMVVDTEDTTIIGKWFRSLFKGAPFALDNEITMFQVFPDYTGMALNSLGNACDQIIFYGKVPHGAISENNEVEVYGNRDSNNNVIASVVRNKASGTIVTPSKAMSATAVRVITAILIILIAVIMGSIGTEGIIWAAVIILCITNFRLVMKIIGAIIGALFSMIKRLF